jgi:hypothetical protein
VIEQIHAAIEALLAGDALFVADMQALALGAQNQQVAPQVLLALRDPAQIPQAKWPALLVEAGDGEAESITNSGSEFSVIGYTQQGMAADVEIGLIWHQADPDTAYRQRLGIQTAFIDLFLRNPDPGDAVLAYVRAIRPDRGALHPTQTMLITVRVEYAQQRISR